MEHHGDSGDDSQENSLNQHRRGQILGVLRLALIPLRGIARRSGWQVRNDFE